MYKNYLVTAWRSIRKDKTNALINIIGLSAGLTCFAFIFLWVSDERSFDKFNTNYDRIVRLTGTAKTETGVSASASSSAPMAKALKADYPEVENTVRLDMREDLVNFKGKQVQQPGILVADPSIFEVFSYTLSTGDVATALNEPYSIVLTQSTAKKYFGDTNPMGQTLNFLMYDTGGRGADYKVTGIMPDPPRNAHFTFNCIISFKTIEAYNPGVLTQDGWGDASFYTYLLLKKGVDYKQFSPKIAQFYKTYVGERYAIWKDIYNYQLQPLADIHLRSNLQYEIGANGNISQVNIFLSIGIFILLLAGINYTNLATARSAGRAKEVGIKKVIGAVKRQLIIQYLAESVVTALIALALAFALSVLVQPYFNQLTGKNISLFAYPGFMLFLAGVTVLLGIVAGAYPAVILSSFKPAAILKGSFKSSVKGIMLRKTLVVSQFVITLVLITGIIIIFSQMSYVNHKDLGYNKDAVLFLRVNGNTDVINGYNAFKTELSGSPLITGMATSNSVPVGDLGTGGAETVDAKGRPLQVNTARLRVDANYFGVYGVKISAGKNFTPTAAKDSITQIVLNEAAVKKFGWQNVQAAIGKPFKMGNQQGRVVAVVHDFNYNTLQHGIEPLAIYPVSSRFSRITIKANIQNPKQSLAFIEQVWQKHFPSALFDYDFLDQHIKQQYIAEERFSSVFLYFSILSLLIACLGLYGLISFTAWQKTKEIGIRKVFGATVNGIAAMLSKDFLKLVLFASFIALPITWYIMNQWLQNFAYRISISWWMFASSALLVMVIALATVGYQAVKAALANPVKSLRTE